MLDEWRRKEAERVDVLSSRSEKGSLGSAMAAPGLDPS